MSETARPDRAPKNLPVPLTSFVGRAEEIDAVCALVREHRLITLTGAGGCGKTRLALQVADRVSDEHLDGTHWVDLAPMTDSALVPAAVAAVLGMSEPPEPINDAVVGHLAARSALVVLDNCEHLVEACATLAAEIAQACPAVTVLTTSRELLGVAGESRWPVPPLTLPSDGHDVECESVQLFVDRARAASPAFALTPANVRAVVEICERLDGIPLAIELAAARIRVLSAEQIAEGLADRFHVLTGTVRGALPRQRTLEGSVEWSHGLLDDRARTVFRRLGVFTGTFTLDAAETVCGGDDVAESAVLDVVSALVDRSLVQVVDEAGARTRYRLLETIRDYARHRLSDAGEATTAHEAHLAWCMKLAVRASAGLEGDDPLTWLVRVDTELNNLRVALDWSTRAADDNAGVCLVSRLAVYWFARGEVAMRRERLEATITRSTDDVARACSLAALCMVAYRAGDMADAIRFGDEAIAAARAAGDHRALGRALHARAWVRFWGSADRVGAWADFVEADGHLVDAGDSVFIALNRALLGWSYIDTSRAPAARALLADALGRTAPTSPARAYALFALGWLDSLEGRPLESVEHLEAALGVARAVGDRYIEVFTLSLLAMRTPNPREMCDRGLALALEHRIRSCEASMRYVIATLNLAEGDAEGADAEMQKAFEATPMPWFRAVVRGTQAHVALALSRHEEARRHADEAIGLGRTHDSVLATGLALAALATLARREHDLARADDLLQRAIDASHEAGFAPLTAALLGLLAGVAVDGDRPADAARLLAATSTDAGVDALTVLQPLFGPDLVRLHDVLRDSFAASWAEGTSMSLDDAVNYARRSRGRRKRPASGWDSLTPTEWSIVDLVVKGLTNPQIGQRLFISPRTVQAHLAHVFAKLDVATRAELAAAAATRRSSQRP